jgi:hypothetical protein
VGNKDKDSEEHVEALTKQIVGESDGKLVEEVLREYDFVGPLSRDGAQK